MSARGLKDGDPKRVRPTQVWQVVSTEGQDSLLESVGVGTKFEVIRVHHEKGRRGKVTHAEVIAVKEDDLYSVPGAYFYDGHLAFMSPSTRRQQRSGKRTS